VSGGKADLLGAKVEDYRKGAKAQAYMIRLRALT
jgi:hypothetical protein